MKIENVYERQKNMVRSLEMTVQEAPKSTDAKRQLEEAQIILSALEKQIPKEPMRYTCENDTCYNHTKCRDCGGGLDGTEKYCRDCGQRLK